MLNSRDNFSSVELNPGVIISIGLRKVDYRVASSSPGFSAVSLAAMAVSRALAAVVVIATIAYCANAMVPLPKKFTYGSQTATLSRVATFHTDSASGILQRAVSRIQSDIFIFPSPSWPTTYTVSVSTASDDENLQFGVGACWPFMQHRFYELRCDFFALITTAKRFLHRISPVTNSICLAIPTCAPKNGFQCLRMNFSYSRGLFPTPYRLCRALVLKICFQPPL